MNGRKEKARQGGWNGGFAPYDYYLKDKILIVQEEEAEVIRLIYDKFANSNIIEAIRELVSNETFAKEVKARIGTQIDTTNIDREIKNYEAKLREIDLNKARLENEIDTLPEDIRYHERKLHDMTIRLDGLYDIIVELEEIIEDVKLRRQSIERDAITLDNVYKIMINFEKVYE